MARTVHRGFGRGQTPQEARHAGALRAAATKARLQRLQTEYGVKFEVVKAGWDLVKGRKLDTREAWFSMHEARTREAANHYQKLVIDMLKLREPLYATEWSTPEWVWSWY